jgi:N-acetylmuramoyl-L-alanine amidase
MSLKQIIVAALMIVLAVSCTNNSKSKGGILENKKLVDTPSYLKPYPMIKTDSGKIKIMLDAGHGGDMYGATSDTLKIYEKTITRSIVNYMMQLVDTSVFYVYESRKADNNTHLHRRIDTAWMLQPELLVSIHANDAEQKDSAVNGFEMLYSGVSIDFKNWLIDTSLCYNDKKPYPINLIPFIPSPYKDKSIRLSKILMERYLKIKEFRFNGYKERGQGEDRVWLLYAANVPTVLVETGYVSNRSDLAKLIDPNVQQKIATAVWEGIIDYLVAEGKITTRPILKKLKPVKYKRLNLNPKAVVIDAKTLAILKSKYKDPFILKQKQDSVLKQLNQKIELERVKVKTVKVNKKVT